MKTAEARALGGRIAALVGGGRTAEAYALLSPILSQRTPFALLRHIGKPVGALDSQAGIDGFLALIAGDRTEGGWVVMQGALARMLDRDLVGALARCREYIVVANLKRSSSPMCGTRPIRWGRALSARRW